jgi:2-iminobutanoate/2-iminopropanoate deaminase
MKQVIRTSTAPVPISPISQATKAGGFIYTAGMLGRTPDGVMAAGGMEAEARQALENLKAVLAAGGATLADVLRVEVHVADLGEMAVFNQVWREYFPTEPPARLGVQAATLAAGARVELMAVAYCGQ